jgi:hypothetical protein
MTKVILNKKEVKKLVGNINDEKIDNILSMIGLGVEKITYDSIEVEVTPNRPDMLSQSGILRALESYVGKRPGIKEYKINKPEKNYEVRREHGTGNSLRDRA